jgi:2-oxoglutarate dehydrogenase E2 component (dihydrolipoamide succinyltransferase)
MADIAVRLPQWGMGMQEATLAEWLKREGEEVKEDEDLALVEAEKATQVIIAPATGRLREIMVNVGDTVPVETLLAIIQTAD